MKPVRILFVCLGNICRSPLAEGILRHVSAGLPVDRSNLANVRSLAPPAIQHKLHLFLEYTLGVERDVTDPYCEGPDGFEAVYSMLFEGCSSLIGRLIEERS